MNYCPFNKKLCNADITDLLLDTNTYRVASILKNLTPGSSKGPVMWKPLTSVFVLHQKSNNLFSLKHRKTRLILVFIFSLHTVGWMDCRTNFLELSCWNGYSGMIILNDNTYFPTFCMRKNVYLCKGAHPLYWTPLYLNGKMHCCPAADPELDIQIPTNNQKLKKYLCNWYGIR